MIAALFVDPHGCYAGVSGVDLWDEKRDARLYAGPWPQRMVGARVLAPAEGQS